jgi:pyruvate/2-oxoglutarate dehydrogenase complex dihydrolipoamide dehydrogenase (E3) component
MLPGCPASGRRERKEITVTQHFDAAIIGTGQAGPYLANRLSQANMKVAVIERGRFGGTCVNTGCMPTKTLVASAYAAHVTRHAAEYGVVVGEHVGIDMKKVKARKDIVSENASRSVETWLRAMDGCTVLQAHARFLSASEIELSGGERISADRIFINVGGRAAVPSIPGLDETGYLTNSTMMDVDFVPPHLIILGGSYVGLEFAQMFRRFGSEVSIIEMGPRLLPREDDDVSDAVKGILEGENIKIHLESRCSRVSRNGEVISADLDTPNGKQTIRGTHLLLATGRTPNTSDLGLPAAGVVTDEHGFIKTDEKLRTNVPSIWALGDCNGRGAFTHTSYNDHEIVADDLLDGEDRQVSDRIVTYGVFIDPPLGRVGMTEREARGHGHRILLGKRPMTQVGRAVEKGETQGFIKIVVDADTQRILGAAILGTGGDEAVQCITTTMYTDARYTTLQRTVLIHPTVCELIPTVLGELKEA